MNFFDAIILGIIQGITEFLPISSDGHLVITQQFFNLETGKSSLFFDVFLHIGTLVSVLVVFRKTILKLITEFLLMAKSILTGKYNYKNSSAHQKMIILIIISLAPLFVVLLLKSKIEPLFSSALAAGIGFLITTVFLFLAHKAVRGKKDVNTTTKKDALLIGVAQMFAPLPGVSRSGSTISTSLMLGLSSEFAVEYSFVMSIPAIIAATILSLKDAMKEGIPQMPPLLLGALVAAVVGFFAIKLLKYLVKNNKFIYFAYYTLVLGIVTIIAALILQK